MPPKKDNSSEKKKRPRKRRGKKLTPSGDPPPKNFVRMLKRHSTDKVLRKIFCGENYEARLEAAIAAAKYNEPTLNPINLREAVRQMRDLKRIIDYENNYLYPKPPKVEVLIDFETDSQNDAILVPTGINIKKEREDEMKTVIEKPKYTLMSYIYPEKKWKNLQTKYILGKFEPPLVKLEVESDDDFQPKKKKSNDPSKIKKTRTRVTSPRKRKN